MTFTQVRLYVYRLVLVSVHERESVVSFTFSNIWSKLFRSKLSQRLGIVVLSEDKDLLTTFCYFICKLTEDLNSVFVLELTDVEYYRSSIASYLECVDLVIFI